MSRLTEEGAHLKKLLTICAIGLLAGVGLQTIATAQALQPVPEVVPAPLTFATSTEHYEFLKALHKRGTRHTSESVPKWEGLWEPSYNNVALRGGSSVFFEGAMPVGLKAGGKVREGVLSPEYEAAFKQRRENMLKYNEQPYDRLTTCEPAGMPRWLLEPYVREFVNTPNQSWWLNDLANDTRRIYIDQDHKNIDGAHSPNGDSVGFWAGNKLIVHTIDVWPMDYFRGYPPTSNEFEAVEVYEKVVEPNGLERIVAQVTFYDKIGLAKPINAVYTWTRAYKQEQAGYRMRHWDCNSAVQVKTENNETSIRLPGESQNSWLEMRAPDLPPTLTGQTQTPGETDFDLDDMLGQTNQGNQQP
ncbi:MAG TPA: hypothetical protein VNS34_04080 [Rhizobiaceae bacterium]|nr:hypothetical protein [Rhizobiaceae bacterium]